MSHLLQHALDLLYPPRCVHCHRTGSVFCSSCLDQIHSYDCPWCSHCGRPLERQHGDWAACATCDHENLSRALAGIWAVAVYEGSVRSAVIALKFQRQRRVAEPLGKLLAEGILRWGISFDLIVPVPLHIRRFRERGYNQSELLARNCARFLRLPVENDVLQRVRATRPQTGLTASDRRQNVQRAFAITPSAERIAGKRILLIDDVTTTGSTLEAAAQALRAAHPSGIWAATVSRPDLQHDQSGQQPEVDIR